MRFHLWYGMVQLQNCWDKEHAQLHILPIFYLVKTPDMPTQCHTRYLQGRRASPFKPSPLTAELSGVDSKLQTIKTLDSAPPNLKSPPLPLWMYPKFIRLIDKRVYLRHKPRHNRNMKRGLIKDFRNPLWWTIEDEPRSLQHQPGRVWRLQKERLTLAEHMPYWKFGTSIHPNGCPKLPRPI